MATEDAKDALPGSAVELWARDDEAVWRAVLDEYEARLESLDKHKEGLAELDAWRRVDLPALVLARDPEHLTKADLVQLMEWKLTRGKFRPTLRSLIASNSEEAVVEASTAALELALQLEATPGAGGEGDGGADGDGNASGDDGLVAGAKAALKRVCVLRGVGPATGSAILSAVAPSTFPFMADEALQAVMGDIKYTGTVYNDFALRLRRRARRLGMTAQELSECLWCANVPATLEKSTDKRKKKAARRRAANHKRARLEAETGVPSPRKKKKMEQLKAKQNQKSKARRKRKRTAPGSDDESDGDSGSGSSSSSSDD